MLAQRLAIVGVGAALLALYTNSVLFIPDGITFGILDAARNLAQGRGLVTHAAPPAFIPYYDDPTPPFPYLWYPFVPFVTSVLFFAFGSQPTLALVLPVVMYVLSGLAVFELGRRLFNPTTGLLAAIALLAQPLMIETAMRENFTDPVLVCLLVSAVLAVFVAADETTTRRLLWLTAAGVLLGLCQYVRSAATTLYLPTLFLVAVACNRRRATALVVFVAACLVVQLPLFVWNVQRIGTLTFTPTYVFLAQTPSFPAHSAMVSVLSPDFPVFQRYGTEVIWKWVSQMWVHYKYFFTLTSPLLLVAFILFGATQLPPRQRVFWSFTCVLYLTLSALNSLYIWDNRYLLPVVPFIALAGIAFMRERLSTAALGPLGKWGLALLLAVLIGSNTADFFYQQWKARSLQPRILLDAVERAAFMKANLRPSDVVMAVDAPLIAWETSNTAVGLPLDPDKAALLRNRYVRFNAIVLEGRRTQSDLFRYSEDWYQIAAGDKTFMDFRPVHSATLTTGQRLVLLRSGD
jgi:Dolichyl-phosphate-mannose-protein mannosyltransferase